MKVNNFKVREIDGEVAKILTDKQAGELYKAICAYNFNNEEYRGKDATVRSVFALMKESFDKDKFFRETGKIGGEKSANLRRENDVLGPCVARAVIGGDIVTDMLKNVFGEFDKPDKSCKGDGAKNKANFAKS